MKNSFFSEEKTVVLLSSYIITYIYYTYNFVYNLCSSRLKNRKKYNYGKSHSILFPLRIKTILFMRMQNNSSKIFSLLCWLKCIVTDLISGGNSGFFLGQIHRFLSRSYSANVNFSSKSWCGCSCCLVMCGSVRLTSFNLLSVLMYRRRTDCEIKSA